MAGFLHAAHLAFQPWSMPCMYRKNQNGCGGGMMLFDRTLHVRGVQRVIAVGAAGKGGLHVLRGAEQGSQLSSASPPAHPASAAVSHCSALFAVPPLQNPLRAPAATSNHHKGPNPTHQLHIPPPSAPQRCGCIPLLSPDCVPPTATSNDCKAPEPTATSNDCKGPTHQVHIPPRHP